MLSVRSMSSRPSPAAAISSSVSPWAREEVDELGPHGLNVHTRGTRNGGSGWRMGPMIFDGFVHQLPDIDPEETQEWLDSLDARRRRARQDPGPVLCQQAPRAGPRAAGRLPGHGVARRT